MYRDILVHLDGGARQSERVLLACALARRFSARLLGLPALAGADLARAEGACASLTAAAAKAGVEAQLLPTRLGDLGRVAQVLVEAARCTDLTVIGQYDAEADRHHMPAELAETLILESGGPVLIVPYIGSFESIGERVMLAWNGSREAARALHDAQPLLLAAKELRIVSLAPSETAEGELALPGIDAYCQRRGLKPFHEVLRPDQIGVMDLLLSRSADWGADLLVMGGHGHYGFPYLNRGAGTRHVLRQMTVPVLLSH